MKYLEDADFTLYNGDALDVLRTLPDESVDCCITSPPYWGLRDYGTGTWEGGEPVWIVCPLVREEGDEPEYVHDETCRECAGAGGWYGPCDHLGAPFRTKSKLNENWGAGFSDVKNAEGREPMGLTCSKCGATRIDNQLGLEPTPEEYVARMVEVFREVRRVLASHGTCWVNIGDSYFGTGRGPSNDGKPAGLHSNVTERSQFPLTTLYTHDTLKGKDLCGIPWRLAFALQQPYYTGRIKDERDRIWLAAMIEAEGCLFIHRRKAGTDSGAKFTKKDGTEVSYARTKDTFGAGLEVASTDRVVVERCLAITGLGSISEQTPEQDKRRKQTIYRWNLRTNECRDVIRELYPHFIAKRHEARLLIGCPSSGDDARKAWESLKALHQGQSACIDFAAPESLFEAGWYLRSDIIWSKRPNPMPESVTDRPTKAHEYVFLLSKQPRYFWDQEAVREPQTKIQERPDWMRPREVQERPDSKYPGKDNGRGGGMMRRWLENPEKFLQGRNIRSVWEIATQPFPEAHFATFPEELVRRCLLAGTSEKGKCPGCGAPWVREVERESYITRPTTGRDTQKQKVNPATSMGLGRTGGHVAVRTETLGWRPSCICQRAPATAFVDDSVWHAPDPVPCVVLDPFLGSGTVALVARKHGRRCVGIELSAEYCEMIRNRTQQLSLLADEGATIAP